MNARLPVLPPPRRPSRRLDLAPPARALLAALLAATPGLARPASAWPALATEKLRPSAPARAAGPVAISAARNEFEAFQIGVTGAATGVSATATALTGPGGTLPAPRLHRVALIDLRYPSALDGGTGRWPDALVPEVDALAGERRNAFPFDVPAGESRAVWAEVLVPAGAAPGEYAGEVRVVWDGGGATVPVRLTVHPFTLPSTASLKSAFGLSWGSLLTAHGVPDRSDAFSALRARYGRFALDHRVTLSRIDDGDRDLSRFLSYYGAALDGTDRTRLAGARMTALEYIAGTAALPTWMSTFRARGWADEAFQYTCDEPPLTCAWADIPVRARSARANGLRTLVTTSIQQATSQAVLGDIDLLVPVINFLDGRSGGFAGNQRPRYDAWLAGDARRELWAYQSCMSHGCGGTVDMGSPSEWDREYTGWPSYVIDASAVRNRAMQWLAFRYDLSGELYYETTMAYGHDPWTDQWDFSGNGDGTLFYPGTPARIGGTTQIPVASLRLAMIREGMEDYEYLKLVSELGDPAFARATADALFPRAFETERSPEALMAARAKLAARIVALSGGAPPPVVVDPPPGGGDPGPGPAPVPVPPPAEPGLPVPGVTPPPGTGCSAGAGGLAALAGLALGLLRRRRR